MLEIVALIFLCKRNGEVALKKGLKPGAWKLYTVLAWLGAEIVGVILGIILFTQENILGVIALGLVSAFGGYLIIKSILDKKPDIFDDEINRIGVDDLKP